MSSSRGGGGPTAAAGGGHHAAPPPLLACPICVETIEDAFVTPCGHTFCFKCISTHLKNKSSCPSCGAHLVQDQVHPNFLLNKVRWCAGAAVLVLGWDGA
jgi:E3 ubiquitin-protein ligase RFWD2